MRASNPKFTFMRLFVGLDLDESIRSRIATFLDGIRGFAPDARWVHLESLHVTLKFIGEMSVDEADKIKQALATIRADTFDLNIRSYGFFPGARAPRVFWIGIDAAPPLNALAAKVDETLASLNIPKEEHTFNAHLTLARAPGGSGSLRKHNSDRPNRNFHHLQEKVAAFTTPEFGTMTVREFFLYRSQLLSGGSKYTKLAAFALR
jgi:2'-5' RNA ligase